MLTPENNSTSNTAYTTDIKMSLLIIILKVYNKTYNFFVLSRTILV